MRKVYLSILLTGVVATLGTSVQAGDSHPVAQPFGGAYDAGEPSFPVERERAAIPVDHLVLGADHILDQQCHNGGFGWPHADCSATYHHITGPILLGVLGTWAFTQDGNELVGAVDGGTFDLTYTYPNGEARFPTFTPFFMGTLALAADNTSFSTHVSVHLFDALAAASYGPDDYDTAGWIASIQAGRIGAFVNLRPWEFHTLIPAARVLGQPGQDDLFEQALLDGLNTLDNTDPDAVYSDIIGLAGAVRGLAFAHRLSFPPIVSALDPDINGIDTLEDLAAYLASLQNPDGSWDWHSNLTMPTIEDEDVQTSAYALLALLQVNVMTAADYQPATELARDWIVSMQLPDGGFLEYLGGPENTEVEGEAVNAMAAFDAVIFVGGFESGTTDLWSDVAP